MARQRLDQYYTKPAVAQDCWAVVRSLLWQIGWNRDSIFIVEPSAGRGAFLDAVGQVSKMGIELDDTIAPREEVLQGDFLDRRRWDASFQELRRGLWPVVIGNPPFGVKGDVALDFLNEALELAGVVGFILPLGFRKWSSQSHVRHGAHLLVDRDLPEEAFFAGGKDFALRCCFQVWSRADIGVPEGYFDLRLQSRPSALHDDFSAWQYNRTPEAEKYFDYDWDFAVLRQGYGNYSKHYFDRQDLDRKQQWIFFKAHSEHARHRLLSIDFDALSRRNTGIPGFGKADVVQAYEALLSSRPSRKKSLPASSAPPDKKPKAQVSNKAKRPARKVLGSLKSAAGKSKAK